MKKASLIIGIIAIVGMLIGFIPCLGWFNWFNLPLAIVGIILGAVAYNEEKKAPPATQYEYSHTQQNQLPLGLILCCIAFTLGLLRLFLGGGIL